MAKSNFIVRGGADFTEIDKKLKNTQNGLSQFKGKIEKTSGGISKGLGAMADGLGLSFLKLGKLAIAGIAIKGLVGFSKQALQVASDLAEVQNVVDVTFGSMSQDVNDFADNALKAYGLSELSAKKYASTMGAMLKSSGLTGEAMKNMAVNLTELSADMASFYNLQNDAAFEKIQAGIAGETKPLRELGINMTVANLEAYALAQGINKSWQEMTQAEQTLLRYNYLLAVTGDAQGDFARTSGTWANQTKLLKEQWQEFMALMGKALIEVLLPVVKFLNWALEGLIAITKEVGKIYAMMTGKEVVSETNTTISDTAEDATDSEIDLGKGIEKAGKAAQKALAPFDEINRLQSSMGEGGGGSIGGFNPELNTGDTGNSIADGIKDTKRELEGFFPWLTDKWNNMRGLMTAPVWVPAPIFAELPDPIYYPNWGLVPEFVPAPEFEEIPDPVYVPNWGLEPPTVPAIEIPPINKERYALSLAELGLLTAGSFDSILGNVEIDMGLASVNLGASYEGFLGQTAGWLYGMEQGFDRGLESVKGKVKDALGGIGVDLETEYAGYLLQTAGMLAGIEKSVSDSAGRVTAGTKTATDTIASNLGIHHNVVGAIAAATAAVYAANWTKGLMVSGENTNKTISTEQENLQIFGKNVGTIAAGIAAAYAANMAAGYITDSKNFIDYAHGALENAAEFGRGMLKTAGETAKGFARNMAAGYKTAWDNFVDFMDGISETIKGTFREHKDVIIKTGIVVGSVALVGLGAALLAPVAIPYAAAALGGLAAIPAFAAGGITDGPTLAMVGDNPGGREVISPLDDLMGMIKEAVQGAGGSDTPIQLIVNIGEDILVDKVVTGINRKNRIDGKTVITV